MFPVITYVIPVISFVNKKKRHNFSGQSVNSFVLKTCCNVKFV